MDPSYITSEMGITGFNRSILFCCILGCGVALLYIYLYDTGSLYCTNIQYAQLLYWAILGVHIYYPVSFILGHCNVPMLSDLTSFYWFTLIDQDFIISPLFSMALSFVFGSLYWTNVLQSTIINLGRSTRPVSFIYINYLLVHSTDPCSYILPIFLGLYTGPILFLVFYISPLLIQISLIHGLVY